MICVADTNILSSFLGIGRLELLLASLGTDHVFIPPRVRDELEAGVTRGRLADDTLRNALVYSVRTITVEEVSAAYPPYAGCVRVWGTAGDPAAGTSAFERSACSELLSRSTCAVP